MEDKKQMKIISSNISRLLDENNMGQNDLAKILKVSESAVGKWILCHNAPSMGNIQKIANYFNIPKSAILEENEPDYYYYDKETQQIAEDIANDKELKLLFSSARDASPEDLRTVHEMLKALKRKENHED